MPDNAPQLRDIHVPAVSNWWPLAPGWWLLLAIVVTGTVALVVMFRRRAARRRRTEAVLGDVRRAAATSAVDGNAAPFAASASQLLRRVARTRDPAAVTLTGTAWRDALAALAPKQDVARLASLDAAMYKRQPDVDVAATLRDVEAWVHAVMNKRPAAAARRRRTHGMA